MTRLRQTLITSTAALGLGFLGLLGATPAHAADTVSVSDAAQLRAALESVNPGDTIELAAGNYDGGFATSRSGTPEAPIRLTAAPGADRNSVKIKGTGIEKGSPYALHLNGASHWNIENVGFENASKGVVLDRSNHVSLANLNVVYLGEEGVHLRTCSSDNELRDSAISWTGRSNPGIGEGVYVGTAASNLDRNGYACDAGADRSDRNRIHHNWIADTPAEGADLKEGTSGGELAFNTFERTGSVSREESSPGADSAIDVKGSGWNVVGNVVAQPLEHSVDAIQTHTIDGHPNVGNVFSGNRIYGAWPGVGIKLTGTDAGANTVRCDNAAEAGTNLSNRGCEG